LFEYAIAFLKLLLKGLREFANFYLFGIIKHPMNLGILVIFE
jgi:hypothetical protein